MENRFIVNIIHRPEMVPEYAEKVTGQGKSEDISRKALLERLAGQQGIALFLGNVDAPAQYKDN